MKKYFGLVPIIGITWGVFQLYLAGVGPLTAQVSRSIHLAFALALAFAVLRRGVESNNVFIRNFDYLLVIISLSAGAYVFIEQGRLVERVRFVSELTPMDYFYGLVIPLIVLEASRRAIGKAMTILAVLFVVYAFAGPYLPGLLKHNGLELKRVVEVMMFSSDGIIGVPVGVVVDYVFYFVLFAAFLEITGGGKLIIDMAFKLTGKAKGGPAKAAVIASGGMGSISGSAVANVASTGIFTIPLMKKVGYSPKFAASIEALASNGGQIMPPIMGAAAFLMASSLGLPYTEVVIAAIIPAVLYYIAIFVMVHFQADKIERNRTTQEISKEEIQKALTPSESILKRFHLLVPLGILIFFIFSGKSLQISAFWSIVALIVVSNLFPSTRTGIKGTLDAFVNGAKQSIQVTIPCAVAGIIVGVVLHTGLGLKFTALIIQWSFGIEVISVLLVALACIILGMGMPTTSAYIMASVLLAPSLQQFGFEPIAAHMFVMYFAVFSMITPPVALGAYAAAGIAKSNAHETGLYAFYLGIPGILIAFAFLWNPALLLIGDTGNIIWSTFTTIIGIISLTIGILGYLYGPVNFMKKVIFFAASILLILNESFTDIAGLIIFFVILFIQVKTWKRQGASKIDTVST